MQAVVPGQNGGTTTFRYDPFGRRIQKSGPLGTTNYLYDGSNVLDELDTGGSSRSKHVGDTDIDGWLSTLTSGSTGYYERDGLGSVTSLSNSTGGLESTNVFDSFGRLTAPNGTLTTSFRYTGRELDQETGLYYDRARYYSTTIGRFVSEDPLGVLTGNNFYLYVRNDPTDESDPLGLFAHCFFNQVGGGIVCYSDSGGGSMSDPKAYSGYSTVANNPAWQSWEDLGVISEGDYWIGPPYNGDLGKPQFRLTPVKDPFMHIPNMFGRKPLSFLIHADSDNHPGKASSGCIVTSKKLREWLAKEGGGVVRAYNPGHFLYPLDRFLNNPLARP